MEDTSTHQQPSPLTPPTLRADLPLYPQLTQLVRVTAATVPGPAGVAQFAGSSFLGPTLYVGFVQQIRNDSLLPRDREPCLVDDVNGLGLRPGFYNCRLVNSFSSLPLFAVESYADVPLTVQDDKGSSLANISSIELHNAVVTNPRGAGTADWTIDLASQTNAGIVSASNPTQKFNGLKEFLQTAVFDDGIGLNTIAENGFAGAGIEFVDQTGANGGIEPVKANTVTLPNYNIPVYLSTRFSGSVAGVGSVYTFMLPPTQTGGPSSTPSPPIFLLAGQNQIGIQDPAYAILIGGTGSGDSLLIGKTGTDPSGNVITGGIVTTIGSAGSNSIIVGTTPVTGGTDGSLLTQTSGKVSEIGPGTTGQVPVSNGSAVTMGLVVGASFSADAVLSGQVFGF